MRQHYKLRWGRSCFVCTPDLLECGKDDPDELGHLPWNRKPDQGFYNQEPRHSKPAVHSYWGVKTEAGIPLVIGYE